MFELQNAQRPAVTDRENNPPPTALDAEVAIIGGLLIEEDLLTKLMDRLKPDDFYRHAHKVIFDLALELQRNNRPVNAWTIQQVLKARGRLEEVGGVSGVTEIVEAYCGAALIDYQCDLVIDAAQRRLLIKLADKAIDQARDAEDSAALLADTTQQLNELAARKRVKTQTNLHQLLIESGDLVRMKTDAPGIPGLSYGYIEIDHMTGGLTPKELTVIAARPSMGKTALACNILANLIKTVPVALFSLEMSKQAIARRMLALRSKVPTRALRNGDVLPEDLKAMDKALHYSEQECHIFDAADDAGTVQKIEARVRQLEIDHVKPRVIIIDHLSHMRADSGADNNRTLELDYICQGLKQMAVRLDVAVVLLCQLNRGVEQRQDKRPLLSDLRESGGIEQNADVVLMIYREDYYNPETENVNVTEIIVRKNREGELGTAYLLMRPMTGTFEAADPSFKPTASAEQSPRFKRRGGTGAASYLPDNN